MMLIIGSFWNVNNLLYVIVRDCEENNIQNGAIIDALLFLFLNGVAYVFHNKTTKKKERQRDKEKIRKIKWRGSRIKNTVSNG